MRQILCQFTSFFKNYQKKLYFIKHIFSNNQTVAHNLLTVCLLRKLINMHQAITDKKSKLQKTYSSKPYSSQF